MVALITQRSIPVPLFLQSDLRRFLIRVELGSQQGSEVHEKLRLCTDSDDRNDELFGRESLRRASSDVIKDVIVRCSEQVRFDRRRSDDIYYPTRGACGPYRRTHRLPAQSLENSPPVPAAEPSRRR